MNEKEATEEEIADMQRQIAEVVNDPNLTLTTVHYYNRIAFVDHDDWEGMYLDGKLVLEGHHVRLFDVLDALGIRYTRNAVHPEWMEEEGSLPKDFEEVRPHLI